MSIDPKEQSGSKKHCMDIGSKNEENIVEVVVGVQHHRGL